MSDQETVANMERVWQAIIALGSTFTEQEWKTPTDCPGWTVQDQVAHMLGSESRLLELPVPDHTPQNTSHVKNDIGQRNEVWVDWYRSWSGAQVLQRFQEVTGERLKVLRAMRPEDFDAPTQTPIGPGTMRDLLHIRIFDAWVHEQDIRRAVKRPGDLTGSFSFRLGVATRLQEERKGCVPGEVLLARHLSHAPQPSPKVEPDDSTSPSAHRRVRCDT
jgi:uncharacterized protein (TIGR03083 family)